MMGAKAQKRAVLCAAERLQALGCFGWGAFCLGIKLSLNRLPHLSPPPLRRERGLELTSSADAYEGMPSIQGGYLHSTVTDLARLRGLSTSVPLAQAV
jgi:hypothetical protein